MTLALDAHRSTDASRRHSAWLAASVRFLPVVPTLLFLLVFFYRASGQDFARRSRV